MVDRKKRRSVVKQPKPEPKRRARLEAPETEVVSEPGDPLVLQRTFPPGTILRPAVVAPMQIFKVVMCPSCKSAKVRQTSRRGSTVYYQCGRCADPETQDYTVFKVMREG